VSAPDPEADAVSTDAGFPTPTIGALRIPALLQTPNDAVTSWGGRNRTWTMVSTLWLSLTPGRSLEISDPGLPPRRRDRASAIARDHPLATRGARLMVPYEPPWTIVDVSRRAPARGFMILALQRET
jgi:hypothetical protein